MRATTVILTLTILLFAGCKTQQDPAAKAAQQAEQAMWYEQAIQALNDREFVLEADRITFKYGRSTYVTPSTNFISVHGDRATIQMAFNSPYAGPNGIGGITVDGLATNVKIETDKKGNTTFSMMVQGTGVSANVFFQMQKGSNKCEATISPNFSSNRTRFTGYLYPEAESNVFKGRAL